MIGECTVTGMREALAELQQRSPDAPFLALGQTIFWDEPMKAGLALASKRLGYDRPFVAGVHDIDYFAKLPSGKREPGKFKSLPHNDTTTQGLWSAAGEFSSLFGSETVITRNDLHQAGLKFEKLAQSRPDFLDKATEAWGWRGIVSMDESAPITSELPLRQVFPALQSTFDWALDESLSYLTGEGAKTAGQLADDLRMLLCDSFESLFASGPNPSLADLYQSLLPEIYSFAAGTPVSLETTRTTDLLRFNTSTAHLPRFAIADYFANEETRKNACACYDEAVHGGGQYELRRFGTGAVPFDLVVPGKGRGTVRITRRAIIVMTPEPIFITLKKPLRSIADLAAAIEGKLGDRCVLVGKAVSLIGMLAREFVFVFHEGASGYVKFSRKFHRCLQETFGVDLQLNPIFRIRYNAWDALQVSCSWMRLPEPLQAPFGAVEVCAPSIAARWKSVAEYQEQLLAEVGRLRRPVDLLNFLQKELGGAWKHLADEYASLHHQLEAKTKTLLERRSLRQELYTKRRQLKLERVEAERQSGDHFRAEIFEKTPSEEQLAQRKQFQTRIAAIIHQSHENDAAIRTLAHEQRELAKDPEMLRMHDRRRSIELEAELARLRLIRQAIIASRGLKRAAHRPSAWWFRLVSPDGLWFRETTDTAECYLEPLT